MEHNERPRGRVTEAGDPQIKHRSCSQLQSYQYLYMKIYLVTYVEPFRRTVCRFWCGEEDVAFTRARELRVQLRDYSVELEIEPIELPTQKRDLIDWLNAHCYRCG